MYKKLIGGAVMGTIFGAGITAAIYNHKVKLLKLQKAEAKVNSDEEIAKLNSDLEFEQLYRNKLGELHKSTISAFNHICNVDMLADISQLNDIDSCLTAIKDAAQSITDASDIDFSVILDEKIVTAHKSMISDYATDACREIMDIIDNDDVDDTDIDVVDDSDNDSDDDGDNEIPTISPKTIIIQSLDGSVKAFDAEPDIGFEVLDGSDPENNDYCIMAQNIPALYNFLHDSIKSQLKEHYVFKIDTDTFDYIIEDMVITVSLAFIDEATMVVTDASAVVPFEIFGETANDGTIKFYNIAEGELNIDSAIKYFGNTTSIDDIQNEPTGAVQNSVDTKEKKNPPEEKMVNKQIANDFDTSLSDENIQYIFDTIGYNQQALKVFMGKLGVLMRINPEAGMTIYDAYVEILRDIHTHEDNDELTENKQNLISNSLKALINNMKKNYGHDIDRNGRSGSDKSDA